MKIYGGLLFFTFPFITQSIEPITSGIGVGTVAALSMVWMAKDRVVCQFAECCEEPYIRSNTQNLSTTLKEKLFGQHIAQTVVTSSVQSHLRKGDPKKALVLSFHGMTGSGKNYLAQLIAESVYKEGMKSKFVHLYSAKVHFPQRDRVEYYKTKLQDEIKAQVKACHRSLFIFDEVDDLDPGIIDVLKPFLDYHPIIDGVDFRRSIFIFLSNTGASNIYALTLEHWKSGGKRSDLQLEQFDDILNSVAYNNEGGMKRTQIIHRALIDAAVPFLPLEKEHVKQCIKAELERQTEQEETEKREKKDYDEKVTAILEKRSYDQGVFSKMGCKKLDTLVAELIFSDEP